MSRRHTIIISDDLEEKLRKIQTEIINSSLKSVSFSEIVSQMIRESLEKRKQSKEKIRSLKA